MDSVEPTLVDRIAHLEIAIRKLRAENQRLRAENPLAADNQQVRAENEQLLARVAELKCLLS
jgi:FtsZ-binding cell division protein ZapB